MNVTDRNTLFDISFETLRGKDVAELVVMGNVDPEFISVSNTLSQRTKRAIRNSLSGETWRSYVTAFQAYTDWCKLHGISPVPTTSAAICNFLSEQAHSGKRHPTLRIAVCAIAYIHRLLEIKSPTESQMVRSTLRGIARENARSERQADPFTPEIIIAIRNAACEPRKGPFGRMETSEFALHRGRVDIALCSTLFRAGLRRSEAAELRWKHIERQKDGSGLIVIYQSKKRLPDDEQVVAIPHYTMADLNAIRPRYSNGHERVFGLTAGQLYNRVKAAVRQAGIKGSFSTHSGRVGMAKYLKERHAPDHIIRQQGRWRDNRMIDRYAKRAKASLVLKYFASEPHDS